MDMSCSRHSMDRRQALTVATGVAAGALLPLAPASRAAAAAPAQYRNPVIWQDFADIDIIRVGDTYYYSASTMHYSPGAPILRSYDLVNWEYRRSLGARPGLRRQATTSTAAVATSRASGRRRWPTGRATARSTGSAASTSTGPTSTPPPPSRDLDKQAHDDQQLLLRRRAARRRRRHHVRRVRQHARSAWPSCRADGRSQVRTQQVFTTPSSVGTLEGSRFYKRNGSYYIFLTRPANGQYILQVVERPVRPVQMRQVLLNLPGPISGGGVPHQGGLVQTQNGDWYYMAFVDAYPGGRVPALAPITWTADGWPSLQTRQRRAGAPRTPSRTCRTPPRRSRR